MKKIIFSAIIAAGKQKVWETMLQPETYQQWSGAGWPGSFYEGEWKEGAEILFTGPGGGGTLVHIDSFRPFDYIGATHIALLLQDNSRDTTSDEAKRWAGSKENYTFTETSPGNTELTVEILAFPEWEPMFKDGWPNALEKLKELCEG